MNIIFRADASLQIGNGHIMRCLTLAKALRDAGADCRFICREHPGNLLGFIRLQGFQVMGLPMVENQKPGGETETLVLAHADWLGCDWTTDAAQTKRGVGEVAVDWIVVDHYALDARWEQTLRPMCRSLMVIDDLADRAHDCDLLLDQNLGRDISGYRQFVPEGCTVLVGSSYALLRPEFAVLRDESLRRRALSQPKRILISMGGVDQGDATGQVLGALKDYPLPAVLSIVVVMGLHAPWLKRVRSIAKQMLLPTEVKVGVDNMAQLMADSDLAIGAPGGTSWERCCLGLPSIIVLQAANQKLIANALVLSGAAKTFCINEDGGDICGLVAALVRNNTSLRNMSLSAAKIVDGKGVVRVTAQLMAMVPI
jgi:UDP-2,4-diacetamido-2,4,6-trideoxy-beta-L-altropyranose hydrolase